MNYRWIQAPLTFKLKFSICCNKNFFYKLTTSITSLLTSSCTNTSAKVLKSSTNLGLDSTSPFFCTNNLNSKGSSRQLLATHAAFSEERTKFVNRDILGVVFRFLVISVFGIQSYSCRLSWWRSIQRDWRARARYIKKRFQRGFWRHVKNKTV